MIGFLKGTIEAVESDSALIEVQGVGYEVFGSQNTLQELSPGEASFLHIYTHVREDQLVLFGFTSKNEKQLFLSLLKVNGIGTKMAIQILSGAPLNKIIGYISESDIKGLTSLPKVGKKTAEQMILSLKGKLVFDTTGPIQKSPIKEEVQSALVNLGFRAQDVEKVVQDMDSKISVEEGVRVGLQILSKN